MNQLVADLLANTYLCLTPTDKLILLAIAEHATGMRIEEVARSIGCRLRWVARQISTLTRMGILSRVGPSMYGLSGNAEPKPPRSLGQ